MAIYLENGCNIEGEGLYVETTSQYLGNTCKPPHTRMMVSHLCPLCGEPETTLYMIQQCGWNWGVWFGVLDIRVNTWTVDSVQEWVTRLRNVAPTDWVKNARHWVKCGLSCLLIWKERCNAFVNHKQPNPNRVVTIFFPAFIRSS